MTEADIANAIGQRLAGGTALPIVWDNKAAAPDMPYLICEVVPVSRRDPTLAGGATIRTGFAMVTVVSQLDQFTTDALGHAETVAALFPKGLRLTAGDGKVLVTDPATVIKGYRDEPAWRQPVRVPYEA